MCTYLKIIYLGVITQFNTKLNGAENTTPQKDRLELAVCTGTGTGKGEEGPFVFMPEQRDRFLIFPKSTSATGTCPKIISLISILLCSGLKLALLITSPSPCFDKKCRLIDFEINSCEVEESIRKEINK